MEILAAESTNLFVGSEAEPRQLVRISLRGGAGAPGAETGQREEPARVAIRADGLRSDEPVAVGPLESGADARLEIGVVVEAKAAPGDTLPAEIVVEDGAQRLRQPFEFVVAEPGWRMFMVSHFHYDPVWWNTQAAYTETWGNAIQYRSPFQQPGLALVKAHLETARRDADYKFVLAELDYLKPYWDAYPEDRDYVRQLLADGRLEFMGGTYNEPNTNLTSAESTIRNAIYGVSYQRDVLGGAPATAWQLDAFGHDPQFPGIMADAGITSSSWARGPFHEWGPHWVRGAQRLPVPQMAAGETPRMQFPTEFDWMSPSGRSVLTCFMATHYSAGWWMDAAATLEEAEEQVHRLFNELAVDAATKNVLLPVGTDYSPPNKWLTAIARDWNRRYVWPRFLPAIPREFFEAVREEQSRGGRPFVVQTRDMNPIYTGKDVSFIDTKQAQRVAENTLLSAEKFATIASLLGARFPSEAIDKAWRQLLFGAHHDGITGSESDQVYLDLIGGWREALELGKSALDGALEYLGARIDTSGDGQALAVFNPLSWARTDVVRATLELPAGGGAGVELRDDTGARVPHVLEAAEQPDRGARRATIAFVASDVPATGHRTYRAVATAGPDEETGWRTVAGSRIENQAYAVVVDPRRGGAIVSLTEKRSGKQLIRDGQAANALVAYREYPNHPHFAEGPWHLTPDGRSDSSEVGEASVVVEESPIGRRIRVDGPFQGGSRRQEIVLWDGVDRVDFRTRIDDYAGQDTLFRLRFPIALEGGRPVSEVGNAVIGRGFGFPEVDVAVVPFTLDNPAYNWFGLGSTARVALVDERASGREPRASRAIGIAEVVELGLPEHDEAVRRLAVALVRKGVTSTVSRHDGHRYGILNIDSNLPDVRIAIGGPRENAFVAAVLDAAGKGYGAELDRQLKARGGARVWIPGAPQPANANDAYPDLRGVLDLPVLILAGADETATIEAIEALTADLDDATITVEQPADLDGSTGGLEDYTVALLNRGLPGFNVDADGTLFLSVMRGCSGWPSGVWIDPPRRSVPDGSNFQFQHWTHTFEYALAASDGDWRAGATVKGGHEYNNPLTARVLEAHPGALAPTASLISVEPSSVVLTALKPAGNPLARMADGDIDPADGIAIRLYESSGLPTEASISCAWPLEEAHLTDLLEAGSRLIGAGSRPTRVRLEPYEIATLQARPGRAEPSNGPRTDLAPRVEAAQPVFADYWMHNKGAAPMGYQPLAMQIRPWLVTATGDTPLNLPISVASERTDAPLAGTVVLEVPPGWQVTPAERAFRLAPGAHLAFEASVTPGARTPAGRYFVAARVTDTAGQVHEDVVTIDFQPGGTGNGRQGDLNARSATLAQSVEKAVRNVAGNGDGEQPEVEAARPAKLGGELSAEILDPQVAVSAGQRTELRVRLRNHAASEIRGEAQLLSPHDTWAISSPWTQGFRVAPGGESIVTFEVAPPFDFEGGTFWALVKVMYFGRLIYTESVPIEVQATEAMRPLSLVGQH
jgi:alpha-mannosidase